MKRKAPPTPAPPTRRRLPQYTTGDMVEVSSDEDGFLGARFAARVVRSMPNLGRFTVEYHTIMSDSDPTKKHRETVDGAHIRPLPPPPKDMRRFLVGQKVDALLNDAWWDGIISKVLEGGDRYLVRFSAEEETEFCAEKIRVHMEWVNGEWVLPQLENLEQTTLEIGSAVEVSSDEEGFCGAWFTATIVGQTGKDFLVEYHDLRTDDETKLLTETADSSHIRPIPPNVVVKNFKVLEEVDAFHNDGWWVGVVSKVLGGSRYMVYFRLWKEEMEFGHDDLRLHHDWIDGRWMRASEELGM